ncbi:MAG: hypothetical protein UR98_C0001G0016 [Parcubacteria group bacterium GW2011_GWA1_36_12]|nr:MAG: hypothetical protein UR98_C0001G0016 [Parcubacteria group bacterium GW2011_GWA1_36_12]
MIPRYFTAAAIVIIFISVFLLPKSSLKISIFDIPVKQIKANNPLEVNPLPVANFNYQNPQGITARSAIVIDSKTGVTLFEKNATLKHLPASTTKLMTALISLEKCSTDTIITIGEFEKEGTQMGLSTGDQITVENLLYGLLINSGNDAATALVTGCAQSPNNFTASMNQKAEDLKMKDTHFTNPTGFDDDPQYSTAEDLAKLANVAISNPLISKIVKVKSTVVTDFTGNKTYYLENINELLGIIDGLEGVKTGQTEGSLENLITKTTRNGNSVIVVVLGSEDRFTETQNLIEWAFNSYDWVNPSR